MPDCMASSNLIKLNVIKGAIQPLFYLGILSYQMYGSFFKLCQRFALNYDFVFEKWCFFCPYFGLKAMLFNSFKQKSQPSFCFLSFLFPLLANASYTYYQTYKYRYGRITLVPRVILKSGHCSTKAYQAAPGDLLTPL